MLEINYIIIIINDLVDDNALSSCFCSYIIQRVFQRTYGMDSRPLILHKGSQLGVSVKEADKHRQITCWPGLIVQCQNCL